MFRKNQRHLQPFLITNVNDLPEKHRKRLETSWAGVFYRETFCRLDESPFAVLYADLPSRPNVPVNVLVGLESLKSHFDWSDEELYDAFSYDLQVRYALGYREFGEGDFDLRSLYYFRERVACYQQEQGVNLIAKAFEQVTDEQIKAYQLKTGKQRMDSTQIASNMRAMSRLQLLVEVLQRVHRMLNEADQGAYGEVFAPFIQGHAGQYVYHLKGQDTGEHLQKIGNLMQRLVEELRLNYSQEPVYQMLERVFGEHFRLEERVVKTKVDKELSASSLQSPDDLEATYREKAHKTYKGYVANVTETCDPVNKLQLITQAQVAPNSTDDAQLMEEALPGLKARTDLDTLYTDGGYGSPDGDQVLQDHKVEQIQTAIRGRVPSAEKLNLADFDIHQTKEGTPTQITCPQGQTVAVHPTCQKKGFVAHFDLATCQVCPFFQTTCPGVPGKHKPNIRLNFSQQAANVAHRRRQSKVHHSEGRNLRAAVEATMHELKHSFPASKLPVRGLFRMTCMVIGSAMAANARRIQRYLEAKMEAKKQENADEREQKCSQEQQNDSIFARLQAVIALGLRPFWLSETKSELLKVRIFAVKSIIIIDNKDGGLYLRKREK